MKQSVERERLWKKVGDDFRRACLLRRDGKQAEASEILDRQLPETIAAWALVSSMNEADRRDRLARLFEAEQSRVEDVWLTQQIILRQMRDILIPSLCLQVAEEVREVMEIQLAELTRSMAKADAQRTPAPETSSRVIAMPLPVASAMQHSRPQPSFDDLPAIIDSLISANLASSRVELSRLALV